MKTKETDMASMLELIRETLKQAMSREPYEPPPIIVNYETLNDWKKRGWITEDGKATENFGK